MYKLARPITGTSWILAWGLSLVVGTALGRGSISPADQVPYGVASDYLVGHHLLKEGQFQEALQFLHPAYRSHPDVPTIALDFQEALVAEGYLNDALEVMDRLVGDFPDSTAFLLQRSRLNIQLGNTRAALEDLRTVRNKGDFSPEMTHAEARLLAAEGDLSQALDVYRDGLDRFPDRGEDFYLGMVRLLQGEGKTKEILKLVDEALVKLPDAPGLWLAALHFQVLDGQHERALATALQADRHFSDLEAAGRYHAVDGDEGSLPPPSLGDSYLVELADFYVQRGEVERAVGVLEPAAEKGELKLNASLWLARIFLGTGQLEKAEPLVDDILRRWPDAARGWFLLGKLQEGRDQWDKAIPHYAQAARRAPADPEIRLAYVRAMLVAWEKDLAVKSPTKEQGLLRAQLEEQAVVALTLAPPGDSQGQLVLGYAFRTLNDPWRAEGCFERAAADPELKIAALTQRSLCFDEMGDLGRARRVLEDLLKDFPDHPEVANSLGYFLAEKGLDLDRARELVGGALKLQPGNGAFLDSMGWILYRQGELEAAFDYLIQAVNVLPDDPVILEHLGVVMVDMGQKAEGETMLRRALKMGGDRDRIQSALDRLAVVDSAGTNPGP